MQYFSRVHTRFAASFLETLENNTMSSMYMTWEMVGPLMLDLMPAMFFWLRSCSINLDSTSCPRWKDMAITSWLALDPYLAWNNQIYPHLNFLFLEWNIYGIPMNRIKPYSMVFTWDSSFLFLIMSPRGLSWYMIYVSSFISFSFVSINISILSFSIDSFPIEMYGSIGLCVYIDPIHGLTKMCKSSICLCHSMSLFLFTYGIATPFSNIH